MKEAGDKTIVFTNFVDFDSSWGHRRDVAGYAAGLELFDRRLPELMELVGEDDILILTADHGCDPTWTGTDHTREHIPVLVYGPKVKPGSLGHRETFADIGQTLAKYFGLSDMEYGNQALFCPPQNSHQKLFDPRKTEQQWQLLTLMQKWVISLTSC